MDKTAVITGASSGIGRAIAETFASNGIDVVVSARRETLLKEVAEEISAQGGTAVPIQADVRDDSAVERLLTKAVDELGSVDILVNSVGVGHWDSIESATEENYQQTIETNLLGVMNCTRRAAVDMLKTGEGHIVNVSSISGKFPGAKWGGYVASKHGLNGFTRTTFHELRDRGVRVTLIQPGKVDTKMFPGSTNETSHVLDPEEVAEAVLFVVTMPESVCVNNLEMLPMK